MDLCTSQLLTSRRVTKTCYKERALLRVVGNSCYLRTGEAETEDHLEFEVSLVYIVSLGKPGLQSESLPQKETK